MAINLNDLANALTGAQERPAAPRASRDQYGTIALDAQGTPTVMLDGGTDYAPCTCMVGVHHGDRVLAHVVNHKIVVFANITAPTTDDAQALVAIDKADAAAEAADAAGIAAASAQGSADDAAAAARAADQKAAAASSAATAAQSSADAASTAASNAQADATAAGTAASNAVTAANKATYALSDVEKVVGTVNWIAEHGSYELTEDTAIVPGKVYYTRSGTAPDYTYEVVANPEASGLATYYELELDESVQNFLASHLWLDNYGLNLSVDSANGYRIHQGTVDGTKAVGTYVIAPDGDVVSSFGASGTEFFANGTSMAEFGGDGARIGAADAGHLTLAEDSMSITNADGVQAFNVDLDSGVAYSYATEPVEAVSAMTEIKPTTSGYTRTHSRVTDVSGAVSGTAITGSSGQVLLLQMYPDETATFGTSSATVSSGMSVSGNNSKTLTVTVTQRTATAGTSKTITRSATGIKWGTNSRRTLDVVATWAYDAAAGTLTETVAVTFKAESTLIYNFSQFRRTVRKLQYYIASTAPAFSLGTRALDSTIGAFSAIVGEDLYATQPNQVAIGKHNVEDTNGDYALIVGNGTSDTARSNAQAIRWNGLTDVAGRTAYPLFVYSTAPDEADLPVTPCFVLATSDYTLLYYDGQTVNTVPGSKLVMQSGNTKVYASGKVVTVAYDATIAHKNTWTYLTDVIPAGYRPPTTLYNIGFDTGNRIARTLVNSGGQIGGYATVDNARVYGMITYMVM